MNLTGATRVKRTNNHRAMEQDIIHFYALYSMAALIFSAVSEPFSRDNSV